jgi:hypothetical protein
MKALTYAAAVVGGTVVGLVIGKLLRGRKEEKPEQ